MHRPPRLGEQRRHMARRTARLPFEDALSSRSGALVVAVLGWLRRRQRKLVEVQRRQLRAHPVLSGSRMPDPGLGGQGKFVAVIEAAVDTLGELVVDGRVAQRASDSDAHEAVALVEPLHSDHRIVLEQIMRVLDVVEAEAHALEDVAERRRNGIEVDLQAELKRLPGRQALADASELLTRDRFVQAELVTPVGLTAEGLGTEDGAALLE